MGAIFTEFNAMILPIVSLALVTIALFSRYMRSSVLDNLTEDYVRTAKAKGASERRILLRHVLRNSLIPIATLIGLSLPGILSGALITEAVFNYPGMGLLFFQAAQSSGLPGAARHHRDRRRGDGRRLAARGHRVRGARPAGEVREFMSLYVSRQNCPTRPSPSAIGVATIPQAPGGEAAVAAGMLPAGKPRSAFRRGLEVFLENKLAVAGVVIVVFMAAVLLRRAAGLPRRHDRGELRQRDSPARRPAIRSAPTRTGTTCSPG